MEEYDEDKVKKTLINKVCDLSDDGLMDENHLDYWIAWIKEAEAGY